MPDVGCNESMTVDYQEGAQTFLMARVNIETKAFTDARFSRLGKMIGSDKWAAIGRMTLVWNECQERGKCVLTREVIDHIHDDIDGLADMLVSCELARPTNAGFYICGTKGRIEWLAKSRKNGTKGGRPPKTTGLSKQNPVGLSANNPLTLSLTPTLEDKEQTEMARLVDELKRRGLTIPPRKVSTVQRWIEKYGAVDSLLALFDSKSESIMLADNPLMYFSAILRKGGLADPARDTHRRVKATDAAAQQLSVGASPRSAFDELYDWGLARKQAIESGTGWPFDDVSREEFGEWLAWMRGRGGLAVGGDLNDLAAFRRAKVTA